MKRWLSKRLCRLASLCLLHLQRSILVITVNCRRPPQICRRSSQHPVQRCLVMSSRPPIRIPLSSLHSFPPRCCPPWLRTWSYRQSSVKERWCRPRSTLPLSCWLILPTRLPAPPPYLVRSSPSLALVSSERISETSCCRAVLESDCVWKDQSRADRLYVVISKRICGGSRVKVSDVWSVALMILSLLFSVSLGRLTTVSRPKLGLTLSGNPTTYSSTVNIAHTMPVCLCRMALRLYP